MWPYVQVAEVWLKRGIRRSDVVFELPPLTLIKFSYVWHCLASSTNYKRFFCRPTTVLTLNLHNSHCIFSLIPIEHQYHTLHVPPPPLWLPLFMSRASPMIPARKKSRTSSASGKPTTPNLHVNATALTHLTAARSQTSLSLPSPTPQTHQSRPL